MVALQLIVLLFYLQFDFPGSFENCLFGVLGSVLWQPGPVDLLPVAIIKFLLYV